MILQMENKEDNFMYNNIDYLLARLNPTQKKAIIHIVNKLDANEQLTFDGDVGLTGCWEWVPKSFLMGIYQNNYQDQCTMKKAIDKFKGMEDSLVHFPSLIDEFIRITVEKRSPASLFDLLEE